MRFVVKSSLFGRVSIETKVGNMFLTENYEFFNTLYFKILSKSNSVRNKTKSVYGIMRIKVICLRAIAFFLYKSHYMSNGMA